MSNPSIGLLLLGLVFTVAVLGLWPYKRIGDWWRKRQRLKVVRQVLPYMYDEIYSRQRAIIRLMLGKSLLTAREAIDVMSIMSSDDFDLWMDKLPKLEIYDEKETPSEIGSYRVPGGLEELLEGLDNETTPPQTGLVAFNSDSGPHSDRTSG